MPELPEVETSRQGIIPHILGQKIIKVIVRHPKLRWPIAAEIQTHLLKQTIHAIDRRGKYLLFKTDRGTVIIHLGMSGSLRIVPNDFPANKHDHIDIVFANGQCLRYTDPRRFGAFLWTRENPAQHPLLAKLGPEPLTPNFNAAYLFQHSRGRKTSIKQFIMDSQIVVGVGNIYANEALFAARISPRRAAGKITAKEYKELVKQIKKVLMLAIKQGGTTIRNFVSGEGKPGYFKQRLKVYDRQGEPCLNCKTQLKLTRIGQRSTVYCPKCQS